MSVNDTTMNELINIAMKYKKENKDQVMNALLNRLDSCTETEMTQITKDVYNQANAVRTFLKNSSNSKTNAIKMMRAYNLIGNAILNFNFGVGTTTSIF